MRPARRVLDNKLVAFSALLGLSPAFSLTAKAQFETYAENRPLGAMYWLKAVASF